MAKRNENNDKERRQNTQSTINIINNVIQKFASNTTAHGFNMIMIGKKNMQKCFGYSQ